MGRLIKYLILFIYISLTERQLQLFIYKKNTRKPLITLNIKNKLEKVFILNRNKLEKI